MPTEPAPRPASLPPETVCQQRLTTLRAEHARADRRDALIANLRLLVALAFCVVVYLIFGAHSLSPIWLMAPVVAFVALMTWHSRNDRVLRVIERGIAFFEESLARIEDRWMGKGDGGDRHLDPAHPYAADLDLFGKGSLFELLCTCRTAAGEETLTHWLLAPAAAPEIKERQQAVAELRNRLSLREDLHVLGEDIRAQIGRAELAEWAKLPPQLVSPLLPYVLGAVSLVTVTIIVLVNLDRLPTSMGVLALVAELIVLRALRTAVRRVSVAVQRPGRDLAILSGVLARFEAEAVTAPRLVALKQRLTTGTETASARIAHLERLVNRMRQKQNQAFLPIAILLLWDPQCAIAIDRWRRNNGPFLDGWLSATGELEALAALSGHAWEHPADPFPEIVDSGDRSPFVEGRALAHPLLPVARSVSNDVILNSQQQLLLVSGSNMSGKSTLLRTLGSNIVLALAGGTIRGASMKVSPLQLGATLRVQDSLMAGASRFYAEIVRLRLLVDLAGATPPLLFLLDELLAGTNSHDRKIGATAILSGLLRRGAIGLATTHDLALADLETTLAPHAVNVHFEDTLENGVLKFDYRMRPGVVRKSNALELMRAIGLPIDAEPEAG